VEDQELRWSQRLLFLPLVNLEPPPPPVRRILDHQGYFDVTGPHQTEPYSSSRGENLILKEPTIFYLRVEDLGVYKPLIIDLSMPIIVQVKTYECQVVSQVAMETNATTSSGYPHIPSTTITTGGFPPPNKPLLVCTTMVSIASTSGNGLIPSIVVITSPFTHSATGPPFSYGILGFNTNFFLSYSTLQTLGLGAGSLNAPLQGSMGGTSAPYNSIPYKGVHMTPSSPSLGGAHQNSVGQNVNYSSFGSGS
jgi:hypothetical protein